MNCNSKIHVAGAKGLVGSAICRRLGAGGFSNVIATDIGDFDLTDPRAVDAFYATEKPGYVFVAAAKVGASGPTTRIRRTSCASTCRLR